MNRLELEHKTKAMKENFEFVLRCVKSCLNVWQLRTAHLMITRFCEKYGSKNDFAGELFVAIVEQQARIGEYA